jgi:hypothetical protein
MTHSNFRIGDFIKVLPPQGAPVFGTAMDTRTQFGDAIFDVLTDAGDGVRNARRFNLNYVDVQTLFRTSPHGNDYRAD